MVRGRHGLAAVAMGAILAMTAPAAASAAPNQLKVNGTSTPLGIDSAPRFAWQSNVGKQSAYQVEVSKGSTVVWDSGKVASGDDLDVAYGGPARESGASYSWRVKVWDGLGVASDWSAPSSFETGLLNLSDWGSAEWIGGRAKQDHDWTDMTFTSDFRVTTGATGITFLFHAQPVGKAWGEGYAWQVRSLTASTTLFAPAAAGDTNVKVNAVTNFNVGDTLNIESESRKITAVGTQGRATTLSAATVEGATNVRVASVTGLVAGEPINVDGETRTIQTVGTAGATGTGVTLTAALTNAHANGAAVRFNGTGLTLDAPLAGAHAQNVAISTPGSTQLVMATRHYSGNTGVPGGTPAVNPGVNYYNPQSETNPTAVGTRTVTIATINVPAISAADLVAGDHQIKIGVAGNTVTTWLDGTQVDQRTLTGDQLRASGTVGFASGGAGIIRSAKVESPDQPTFSTTFAGFSNPFEAGIPTSNGITLVNKNVMLPIANPAPLLRRAFTTGGAAISRARLYVTGGGYPTVWVNGERVTVDGQAASDPAAANLPHLIPDHTNYDKTVLYNTFNVTGLLKSGTQNVLSAEVGRAFYGVNVPGEWYWNMGNFHGDPRMMARLVIEYADGTSQTVVTDHTAWKTVDGPTTFDSVYTGEKYDARIAATLGDWQKSGYDDSAWTAAAQFNAPGSCPQGACVGFLPNSGALPAGFVPAKLRAQENPPVHVYEQLHAVNITESAPGSDVWIFDMGNDRSQLVAGWTRIRLSGVTPDKAGMTVRFRQDESLSGAGTTASPFSVSESNGFTDGNFQTDYYTLSNAPTQTWAAKYRYGGIRYIEVRGLSQVLGRSPSLAQDRDLFTVEAATSTILARGTFSSNNALLQRIFRNSNYAQFNNYVHKPNDTPSREKNGWTGDGWADSEAGLLNTDASAFMRKWIRDMPDSLISTGEFSEIVPAVKGGYGYNQTPGWNNTFGPTPAWDAAFFAIPEELYKLDGETDVLREVYPAQKRFMDYYATTIPASNGYTKVLGGGLNDYQPPAGANNQAVINHQLYYYFADYMSRIGKLLGRDEDATTYRALADDILRVFISKYWDTTTHAFRKGTVNNLETQNAMGLAYDMVPGGDLPTTDPRYLAGEQSQAANERSVAATIANDIVSRTNHFGAGLMGLRYIFDILNDYGYKDVAYRMVTQTTSPSWGDLIARGNTALTEGWGAASGNHHYMSSVLTWYYQDAGGIRPAAPGYRKLTVKPFVPTVPGTSGVPTSVNQTGLPQSLLDNVDVSLKTARGNVQSKWWRRDDGRVAMIVTVPSNTPTEIWVPTFDKPVDALPSAHFERNDLVGTEPYAVYTVAGGGTYLFNLSTSQDGTVGATVPATLSLTLGQPATFGAFTPGVDKSYDASTTANVISTAGDAALSVTDPSANATGRLVNGTFVLSEPLQAKANSGAFAPLSTTASAPLTLLTYPAPVSNDAVTVTFRQHIGASQALRTGAYSKTLTFTLSTTTP